MHRVVYKKSYLPAIVLLEFLEKISSLRELFKRPPRKSFRENESASMDIPLKFLGGKTIEVTDLVQKESRTVEVPENGKVTFEIKKPAGFLFMKYVIRN